MAGEGTEEGTEEGTKEGTEEGTEEGTGEGTEEGTESTAWRDSIGDEKLRGHAERFGSIEDVVRANVDSRVKLSKSIQPLEKNSSDEEKSTYRKALGIPDTVKGYEFSDVPDDIKNSEGIKESQEKWGKIFHDNNISKSSADNILKAVYNEHEETLKLQIENDKNFAEKTEKGLREEWKEDYDKNVKFADNAGRELFGNGFDEVKSIETKDGKYILDHPSFVRMLSRVGREMGEGTIGSTLSEEEKQTFIDKANDARAKRNDAQAKGLHKEAQRWDAEERKHLEKANANSAPLVGTQGRTS